jgi:sec-independent protein translocase protein TatC
MSFNDMQQTLASSPFVAHLVELRQRLIYAIASFFIVFLSVVYWARDIYHIIAQPLLTVLPQGSQMIATSVTATFFVPMKVTAMLAFVIALPYILYQAWAFIAPGLYRHEKQLVLPIVISSYVLFLVGMNFAYWVVFPAMFGFFAQYTTEGVNLAADIDTYLSLVLSTFMAFGLTFEVPVVVIVLVRMGIVSVAQLQASRPYMIVVAFLIAAIATPPDAISQLMLAIPLCLLYELGLQLAQFLQKRHITPANEHTEEDVSKL